MNDLKRILRFKNRIILGLMGLLVIGVFVYLDTQRIKLKQMTLLYTEDFNTATLSDDWIIMRDGSFHYTGFYADQQVSVADGQLKIRLSQESFSKGDSVYSSTIRSAQTFTSGYFEVTANLPKINEFNAVIALTNDEALSNTDPTLGAKIVFASSSDQPYPLLATGVYYDHQGDPTETQNAFVLSFLYNQPHRFGLLWTAKSYAFYFDGLKLWETKQTAVSVKPLYLTIGFDFPYSTMLNTLLLDQTLIVDSVKIYGLNP